MRAARSVAAGVAGLVVLALVAGCTADANGASSGSVATPSPSATEVVPFSLDQPLLVGAPSGKVSDSIGLIGYWKVTEALGDKDGTLLRLSADGGTQTLMLFRGCGVLSTSWAASDVHFVAGAIGGDQSCFLHGDGASTAPEVSWLASVRKFRGANGGWDLLDSFDNQVARLDKAAGPPAATANDPAVALLPEPALDATVRQTLRVATPLPTGLVAATRKDLSGTWVPAGMPGATASITFDTSGVYALSDCLRSPEPTPTPAAENLVQPDGLPWAGDGSDFLASAYPSSGADCAPVWDPVESSTRTIALDNGYLRLFDIDGNELARLQRPAAAGA